MDDDQLDPTTDEDDLQAQGGGDREPDQPEPQGDPRPPPSPWWKTHPGAFESLIPVWGYAREALADGYDGKPVAATVHAVGAVADAFPGADIGVGALKVLGGIERGLAKGGFSAAWGATRARLARDGFFKAGQEGHHWLIPQGGWGKMVPNAVKNQEWNIKALDQAIHRRIHGSFQGQPQFNVLQRLWYGTPDSVKRVTASGVGHAADQAWNASNSPANPAPGP